MATIEELLMLEPICAARTSPRVLTLSASDLTFALHDCPLCFREKVVDGKRPPRQPMPGMFSTLDRLQRAFLHGQSTRLMSPELPEGVLDCSELRVVSKPLAIPGSETSLRFQGTTDATVTFESGVFGVVDLKTTDPKADHMAMYWLQLHAYALALENPDIGRPERSPITTLGLLCFSPKDIAALDGGDISIRMMKTWVPIPRDDKLFISFLSEVVQMLDNPMPPQPGPSCGWCEWRRQERQKLGV